MSKSGEEESAEFQAGVAEADADFDAIDELVAKRAGLVSRYFKELCEQLPSQDRYNGRMFNLARMIAHSKSYGQDEEVNDNDIQAMVILSSDKEKPTRTPFQIEGYAFLLPFHIDGHPMIGLSLSEDPTAPYAALDPRTFKGSIGYDETRAQKVIPSDEWSGVITYFPGERMKLEVTMVVGDFPPYLRVWDQKHLRRPDQGTKFDSENVTFS